MKCKIKTQAPQISPTILEHMTGNNGRLSATKAQKQKINFFFQAGNKNPNKESKLKPETQK